MNWTEITIKVPLKHSETAAAIANMAVPYGIYIEDYSDLEAGAKEIAHIDLIDEQLIKKQRENAVIHIYISKCDNAAEAVAFLKERLAAANIAFCCQAADVNDSDWNENWKKYFKATEIGEKLTIVPSWETYDNKAGRTLLHIDPGAAFGTGTHATTSLCLQLLEQYAAEDKKMLDIGCGSGILAIASVLLGCEKANGVDIDAQAVKTAKENAEINGVSDKTSFFVGNLAEQVSGKYEIICANIVADVILKLFDTVENYLAQNGVLIASGVIDMRAQEILEKAEKCGFELICEREKENWHAFAFKKK